MAFAARPRRRQRGVTLVELVSTAFVLSFIVAATAALYIGGERQQRIARNYGVTQADLRTALRTITRTVRHGYGVVTPSSPTTGVTVFSTSAERTSDASAVTVRVPEPSGVSPAMVEDRFNVASGTLYSRRADQTSPGTAVITGVQSITFTYLTASGSVAGTADLADMVQISLTAVRDNATTTVQACVALRNRMSGL